MKLSLTPPILFSLILFSVTACTWVELNSAGRNVSLQDSDNLNQTCQRLGTVNAKTRASVVFGTGRDNKKIKHELAVLARNEAAKLNANTIVAKTQAENGEQSFIAYRCP